MEDLLKCQISPLVKYRQNQKHVPLNCEIGKLENADITR